MKLEFNIDYDYSQLGQAVALIARIRYMHPAHLDARLSDNPKLGLGSVRCIKAIAMTAKQLPELVDSGSYTAASMVNLAGKDREHMRELMHAAVDEVFNRPHDLLLTNADVLDCAVPRPDINLVTIPQIRPDLCKRKS